MLSEQSKKLVLHKLVDIQNCEILDFVYLTLFEAEHKNAGYLTNNVNKRYLQVNPKKQPKIPQL